MFLMKHYGGWSFIEVYNLPIGLRHWFYERLVKQYEEENIEEYGRTMLQGAANMMGNLNYFGNLIHCLCASVGCDSIIFFARSIIHKHSSVSTVEVI